MEGFGLLLTGDQLTAGLGGGFMCSRGLRFLRVESAPTKSVRLRMDKPVPILDIAPPPTNTWLPHIEPPLGEWIEHDMSIANYKTWELRCHPVFEARIVRGAAL